MKLIDKDALVAEIERLQDSIKATAIDGRISKEHAEAYRVCVKLISFVEDTLEEKEVDLEKAIDKWICDDAITHDDCSITDVISTAKHFFELGLKAREVKE
jgi:hypothetical protein